MSVASPAPLPVSVVLCSYNPRDEYLAATLESLRQQDFPTQHWELLVIDNNSQPPLAPRLAVAWHPIARCVVESRQGLAHARRRGYLESRGRLVIHADDDTVFAPDYLRQAWQLHLGNPHLGTFGGQLIPRYERAPRTALERRFGEARLLETARWSNLLDDTRCMPWGAGMCLRREVLDAYLAEVARDPRRLLLGRRGERLLTGEDLDLNYVAVRSGYGTGLFPALSLEHFIPAKHLTAEHHLRYKGEANGYSVTLLKYLHFGTLPPAAPSGLGARCRAWLRRRRLPAFDRQLAQAWEQGVATACRDLRHWGWLDSRPPTSPPPP